MGEGSAQNQLSEPCAGAALTGLYNQPRDVAAIHSDADIQKLTYVENREPVREAMRICTPNESVPETHSYYTLGYDAVIISVVRISGVWKV